MIHVYDIVWDTDGISIDDLPEVVDIEENIDHEGIPDYLSDVYGWRVESYCADTIVYVLTESVSQDDFTDRYGERAFPCSRIRGVYSTLEKADSAKVLEESLDKSIVCSYSTIPSRFDVECIALQ